MTSAMLTSPEARTSPPTLAVDGVTVAYDDRAVLDDLRLEVPTGRISIIVGANACGKSTLLRTMARLLTPAAGTVLLGGTPVRDIPTRRVAQQLALLPQTPIAPEGIVAADLVGRGRDPHQGRFGRWTAADDEAVAEALRVTGCADLADRPVDELSGGQRQRVWIAMALAQRTDILLLDEPTTFLDVAHQIDVLDLLRDLRRRHGTTVVMVLHDLNLAARYADHVVALRDGRLVAAGPPAELVTEDFVRRVFGLGSRVVPDPVTGSPLVVPTSTDHPDEPADAYVAPPIHPYAAPIGASA
jgi:iron complex transport system ATP-binding protein